MYMKDLWRNPFHVMLEVENQKCSIVKKCASLGLKHFKVVDVRSATRNSVKHLVELDPNEVKKVKNPPIELRELGFSSKREAKVSIWLESKGCEVCNTILSCDAFLVSGKSVESSKIMYSFMVPDFEAYQKIVSTLESAGFRVTVLKMRKFEPQRVFLTVKQEKIFWLAFKGGFFEYPRKINMVKLATKLGISPSTLSEIIRRGMRRLLEHHFENKT